MAVFGNVAASPIVTGALARCKGLDDVEAGMELAETMPNWNMKTAADHSEAPGSRRG